MAELVLSTVLQQLPVLFEKLSSAALKSIARHKGIDAEIKKWQRSLTQIQHYLSHASQMEITDPSLKQRLIDLQHLAYDIDDLLDGWVTDSEFKQEPKGITGKVRKLISPTNFSRYTTILAELDDICTKLEVLVKEETRPRNNNNKRRFRSPVVDPSSIVGRQAEKDALVQQLLLPADEPRDQNYSIVPIIGMGGVGKTALAGLLYNDVQVTDHFELKAWICIANDFDISVISKEIFVAFGGEVKEEHNFFDELQEALRDHLTRKRFLLVLDDVWSESREDWKTLVRPFYTCSPGSKILITARKDILLKKLGYNSLYKQLESLSDDDSLSLFARNALGMHNFDSYLSLKPYAEGIVKKCGGLPFALIKLGRLLRTKKDEVEHWKEVLNSEIWRLNETYGILRALILSYHDLSAPLKRLFAYCSLFPKDFLFDKEDLVLLWMAEGFLQQATPNGSTEEQCLGRKFFDELLSRSFFQHAPNNESLFLMNDLMNDLATSVATEFYLRLDNESEKNMKLDKYRHMSFVHEQYEACKKLQVLENTTCLRTLLTTSAWEVYSWPHFFLSILTDLLTELPLLRVLSLSDFRISEVPESIGTLRHLRYLNLSRTDLTHLPEKLCNLYNLQSLILVGCDKLSKLPNGFLKLKNMKHLDVRDTSLSFLMWLKIRKLKSLQIILSKIIIKIESGTEIAILEDFKSIYGKISVAGLEKVQNAIDAHEANFSKKRLSELELVWGDEIDDSRNEMLEKEVLNELKPCHDKLMQLKIRLYGGLEFPNWVGDRSFLHLKDVSISGCKRCRSIPPLGQLPSLKELLIEGLDGVEVVGFELFGTGQAFPSLEILSFSDMSGWKKWSGAVFPSLQKLSISDCPNLVEVTLEAMPSLNDLLISECDSGVLRRLVEVASAVKKLDIREISGLNDVVWGGVIEYHLGAVEELEIWSCDEIRYVVKSDADASKILVKLRKLEVWDCDNLVSLGEKEEEDNCRSNLLTSLRLLQVSNCENMERCSCPDGIEELSVSRCSSMTVVSFPKGGHEKLRSLTIKDCWKLLEREWEWEWGGQKTNNNRSSNMPMLEYVCISNWPNLKSITKLNYLAHLTQLIIYKCENLESFPDTLTSLKTLAIRHCPKLDVSFLGDNLTSLEELLIANCPKLDASLPDWVWPPNLCFLQIYKLKKPFSEWDPQNFPTSLVKLELYGGGEEGVIISCSQLSHLLPSSLTSLTIGEFEKLESVSTGLQHLTSLYHLSFMDCPKMRDLPEMLLPSLLSLYIRHCPGLEERCESYWPLISHIPRIYIR